jgi:hypothetical protein
MSATLDSATSTLESRLRETAARYRTARLELGELLLDARAQGLHQRLGYVRLADFAEGELGIAYREARYLIQVAEKARELPVLGEALRTGQVDWSRARSIVRVAEADTVAAWLERAGEVSARELDQQVSACSPGELPSAPGARRLAPCRRDVVLRNVESADAEVIEYFLQATAAATGLVGGELDRGHAIAEACRQALLRMAEEEGAPTGSPHLVVLHHDAVSGETTTEDAEVSEDVAGEASCDHVVIDLTDGPERGRAKRSIPPRVHRAVLARDGHRCTVPGCTNRLFVHLHHLRFASQGGPPTEANLTCLCSQHHRLVHAGNMGVERLGDGSLRFSFDGRELLRPPGRFDLPGDGQRHGPA